MYVYVEMNIIFYPDFYKIHPPTPNTASFITRLDAKGWHIAYKLKCSKVVCPTIVLQTSPMEI